MLNAFFSGYDYSSMFSKVLKLGSFCFVADDSTPISNISTAGLILLMLVHKQHQEKDFGPLQTEE